VPPCAVPTLYVWGDSDPAIGGDAAVATADHVTGPFRFEGLAGGRGRVPARAQRDRPVPLRGAGGRRPLDPRAGRRAVHEPAARPPPPLTECRPADRGGRGGTPAQGMP